MTKQNIKLKDIDKLITKALYISNSNIGVIDNKTYLGKDICIYTYCI